MSGLYTLNEENPAEGTVRGIWRAILRAPLFGLMRLLGVRVEGLANLPPDGTGVLVVSNHLHNLDPLLIEIASPRPIHFMAKEELFSLRPVGWALRKFGNFPVARGKSDRRAVRFAIATLRHGLALGMFPEGTRSRSMRLSKPHPGAGLIAIQGKSLVLPVAVTGSERMPFNGKRPPGERPDPGHRGVLIRFGEPFMLPETGENGKRLGADEATGIMMRAIVAMLPPDYHGVYATGRATPVDPDVLPR